MSVYMTEIVQSTIPERFIYTMLNMISELEKSGVERDYLQVFEFNKEYKNEDTYLTIKHYQEIPQYELTISVKISPYEIADIDKLDGAKIFMIYSTYEKDGRFKDYSTIMFAEEY